MAKANPFRFSTKYQDDETDLLYYGYRYYNANTGRWLSRDPAVEIGADAQFGFADQNLVDGDGDLNPYLFTVNAPLLFIDRFGLATDKKAVCGCKCKGINISYTPKLKKGQLQFEFYKPHGDSRKRYGFILHVKWDVDGDPTQCHYGLNEPPGGVTGSIPSGSVDPSAGTGGWILVQQKVDDNIGIRVDGKGQYSINVNITQSYVCWDAGLDPASQSPSASVGPASYTGSGSNKY